MQILHLLDGNKKFVRAAVLNLQKIFARAVEVQSFDAEIFADSVFDVHDVIAGLDVAEMFNFIARARKSFPTTPNFSAENIFLRQHGQLCVGQGKSVAQVAEKKIYPAQIFFRQKFFHAQHF